VNCFLEEEAEREVEIHPYREEEAQKQMDRLKAVKLRRDQGAVKVALAAVRAAASARANVMPAVMEAVTAYATVGEVCGVLTDVFGRYREPVRF